MSKKAIFLTGSPGSGKDILLKNCFENIPFKEYKLEQIKGSVSENFIVVSSVAYRFSEIKSVKESLENMGYDTMMVFVDVSDKVSKSRMQQRNILEDKRKLNLEKSKENLKKFENLFDYFIVFENNDVVESYNFNLIENFALNFVYGENFIYEKTNSTEKYSILNRLKSKHKKSDKYIRLGDKIPTDRIGDEFSVRNSGIGYPSTTGPFYSEDFSQQYSDTLPAFSSDNRSIISPEIEKRPVTSSVIRKRIKRIKNVAKNAWKV